MSPPNQQFYRDEHLRVDLRQERVMLDSETVTLTRMEYRLLALLVKRAGGGCTSIDSPKGDRTLGCAPVAVAEETGEIR